MIGNIIEKYHDENGNSIETNSVFDQKVKIKFQGKNNKLIIEEGAVLKSALIEFYGDNALVQIGRTGLKGLALAITIGEDSSIIIGRKCSTEKVLVLKAAEGAKISIGDDCMFASNIQIRADDAHPIFDVKSGLRTNLARDITIGSHSWIGFSSVLLKGSVIGEGSVVAMNSTVTGRFPNNCIVGGSPAKVLKENIAWERPNLATTKPAYKSDRSSISTSDKYWKLTDISLLPEKYLKFLWSENKYKEIIEYYEANDKKVACADYFYALALYHNKNYTEALKYFIQYNQSSDLEFKNVIDFCIGNTLWRLGCFYDAQLAYEKAYIMNPLNFKFASSLLTILVLNNEMYKIEQFISSLQKLYSGKHFFEILLNVANRIHGVNKELFRKYSEIVINYIYDFEYRDVKGSENCYIIIQPLIDRPHLFGNRQFSCSVLFIAPKYAYTYYMPFFDEIRSKILSVIHEGCKEITVFSSSNGAFFSLLLGAQLRIKKDTINIKVHAFAPQTNIEDGKNISRVGTYKEMNSLTMKYPFFNHYIKRYGDLKKVYAEISLYLDQLSVNFSAHIYYGSKELVDSEEAKNLELFSFIKFHRLDGFPYHTVLSIYRYDVEMLKKVYSNFTVLIPSNGQLEHIEYSVDECIKLKEKYNCNIANLLPHMI